MTPPYRLAFCPRREAERLLSEPAALRARFSPEEIADLEALADRRRVDRVAGRLAAKRALAAHFSEVHGWQPDERELAIFNDESGRPVLRLPHGSPAPAPAFSISHCAEGGAAAAAAPGRLIGVDIESVVARPPEVIAFVASPGEPAPGPADPAAQARMWTGKEAALKMLGVGLDADAKDVRPFQGPVSLETARPVAGTIALSGVPADVWRSLGAPHLRLDYEPAGGALVAVAYTGD